MEKNDFQKTLFEILDQTNRIRGIIRSLERVSGKGRTDEGTAINELCLMAVERLEGLRLFVAKSFSDIGGTPFEKVISPKTDLTEEKQKESGGLVCQISNEPKIQEEAKKEQKRKPESVPKKSAEQKIETRQEVTEKPERERSPTPMVEAPIIRTFRNTSYTPSYTTYEACQILKISRPTFCKYIYEKKIKAVRCGSGWRVTGGELNRFLTGG